MRSVSINYMQNMKLTASYVQEMSLLIPDNPSINVKRIHNMKLMVRNYGPIGRTYI